MNSLFLLSNASKPLMRPHDAPGRVLRRRAAAVVKPQQAARADHLVEPVLPPLPLAAEADCLGDFPSREERRVAAAGSGRVAGGVEALLAVAAGPPSGGGTQRRRRGGGRRGRGRRSARCRRSVDGRSIFKRSRRVPAPSFGPLLSQREREARGRGAGSRYWEPRARSNSGHRSRRESC